MRSIHAWGVCMTDDVSDTPSLPGLTISDLNTTIDNEPRVRDLVLAKRLRFTNPHMIRKLIERNRTELKTHGVISTVEITSSAKGGRPGKEYWLNEGQALVICSLSRTEQAAAVRHAMITLCMQWRRTQAGQPSLLPPPAPPPIVPWLGRNDWAVERAKSFIMEVLSRGIVTTDKIQRESHNVGLCWITVERAKKKLGVRSVKTSPSGPWT
ncbi:MAG: hypothetical protein FD149_2724 [Rhodospirillaceae bacterium]|nr:MAG: hypothetical protein FD149_2724 [Rhodospirillaceae bacterium]